MCNESNPLQVIDEISVVEHRTKRRMLAAEWIGHRISVVEHRTKKRMLAAEWIEHSYAEWIEYNYTSAMISQ